ncbi:MAG TPA: AMP-binding protein [Candidatus Dormibacteraeota bacterium]
MHRTIPDVLLAAADREPDGLWLRTDGCRLSFGAAAAWVAQAAARLQAEGIRYGDLVVLTARNTPQYLVALLGVTSVGAIAAPTNPAGSHAELTGLIAQVEPRAVISDAELRPRLRTDEDPAPAWRLLDIHEVAGEQPPPAGNLEPLRLATPAADDVAVLIPTSGTTGRSKLVTQTHRAYAMAAEGFPYWMGLTRDDVLMTSLPLFHINAPAYSVLGSLACGGGLVLLPRFSASGFIDAARRHGATEFNAIGAMLEMLMRQPERPDDADTPLRLCYAGPSPTQERQEEIERRFDLRIICGYALSESPYGLIWAHGSRPFGTLGTPRQHPQLGTVNHARAVDEDGRDVAVDATGELMLRNPTVTRGYWGMPDETATLVVDGWLHTGDLVTRNADGTYTFVSRKKEVIRRRGENLSPLDVEEVLDEHPAVLESAVVGVPSDLSEEDVKAFVVAVGGTALDFHEIATFAAARLSAFKVPRYWQALAALPRTPTGRVAKPQLPEGHPDGEVDLAGAHPSGAPGESSTPEDEP